MRKILLLTISLLVPCAAIAQTQTCSFITSPTENALQKQTLCGYYSFFGNTFVVGDYCALERPRMNNHDDYVIIREFTYSTRRCGWAIGTTQFTDPWTLPGYRQQMMGTYYRPYAYGT